MSVFKKINKHLKKGTLLYQIKAWIEINFFTVLSRNKNAAIFTKQCITRSKLKKKYGYILDREYPDMEEIKSDKVWFCWLQGREKAPELVKACYNSVKLAMPEKDIIFLSEDNISEYVTLPDYIQKKYESGKIGFAHYSDLLRITLLCQYGGLWIDSTVLCTSKEMATYISELPLFLYKQADLTRVDQQPFAASNWLISCFSNNKILLVTKDLLFAFWKDYNYVTDYFIFHIFFKLVTEKYENLWEEVPTFYNAAPHTMQFELDHKFDIFRWNQLINISGFHKLNHHKTYNKEDTIYKHILALYSNPEEDGGFYE